MLAGCLSSIATRSVTYPHLSSLAHVLSSISLAMVSRMMLNLRGRAGFASVIRTSGGTHSATSLDVEFRVQTPSPYGDDIDVVNSGSGDGFKQDKSATQISAPSSLTMKSGADTHV